jgi:hypothetical protein
MPPVFFRPASDVQNMLDTLRALLIRRGVTLESWLLAQIKEETCNLPANAPAKASPRPFKTRRVLTPGTTPAEPKQVLKRPIDATTTLDELFPEAAPGCFVDLLNLKASVKNETGPYFLERPAYLNREALSGALAAYLPIGFLEKCEPLESLVPDYATRLEEWREIQSKIPVSESPLVQQGYSRKSGPIYLDNDFYDSLFRPAADVDELETRRAALRDLPRDYATRVRPLSSRSIGRPKSLPPLPDCHLELQSSLEPAGDYDPLRDNPRIYSDGTPAIDASFLDKLIKGQVTLDIESYDFDDFES